MTASGRRITRRKVALCSLFLFYRVVGWIDALCCTTKTNTAMASINERKKNPRRVNEGFGITSVTVDFNMARIIALQAMLNAVKASPVEMEGIDENVLLPVSLRDDISSMLQYIVGDIPSPFSDSLWEDEQPEGLD